MIRGNYGVISGHVGLITGHCVSFGETKVHRVRHKVLLGVIGCHWLSLVVIRGHWGSLGVTGGHWGSLGVIGGHWGHWGGGGGVIGGSLGVIGGHWGSLGVIGFFRYTRVVYISTKLVIQLSSFDYNLLTRHIKISTCFLLLIN